jgi:hypothetical protein
MKEVAVLSGSGSVSDPIFFGCRDSLLYKGSEDNNELGLKVTGWVWNKIKSTKAMMITTRIEVMSSMMAVRLRLWGVDKRTV